MMHFRWPLLAMPTWTEDLLNEVGKRAQQLSSLPAMSASPSLPLL